MIIFVDLEHERLKADTTLWRYFAANTLETKYRLEEISGEHCLILDYRRVSPQVLAELDPSAVVVGGNYTGFQHFAATDLAGLKQVFEQKSRPTLAVCGGFQLMAQVHGGRLGLLGTEKTAGGNASLDTDTPLPPELASGKPAATTPDTAREIGFLPVHVIESHPLFAGLSTEALVYQLHGGEVKRMPEGFRLIARSDACGVQAIAHRRSPLFGVQFHPECYNDEYRDGRLILENFFQLARESHSPRPG
jgi:GMP synthase (glutamine-hydrolysing)